MEQKRLFNYKFLPTLIFLGAAFLLGRLLAEEVGGNRGQLAEAGAQNVITHREALPDVSATVETWGLLFTENWGLGFGDAGKCPSGNSSAEELKKYNAYYVGNTEEKKIYLTFDCGYENGNTEAILDALKKHDASATFFVVGHYLESAPELVKRMLNDA